MILSFVTLHVADVVDILLVAYLLYRLYRLFRGTSAFNIFIAIFFLFVFWMAVKAMKMDLMAGIMKQVFSVGLLAVVVVVQPEIRRSLSRLGSKGLNQHRSLQEWLFPGKNTFKVPVVDVIAEACRCMSEEHQGALIVLAGKDDLTAYEETGDVVDAVLTPRLIESIFFKNNPLHDGAVIVSGGRLATARCILPVSDSFTLSPEYGLRHRSALGISEITDAKAVVVSEETGGVSLAEYGVLHDHLSIEELVEKLKG